MPIPPPQAPPACENLGLGCIPSSTEDIKEPDPKKSCSELIGKETVPTECPEGALDGSVILEPSN